MKTRIKPFKLILLICFCFISIFCFGQNVGIGNPLPDARLNINTGRNIPSIAITDSTSSRGGTMLFRNDKDTIAFEVSTYTSNNPANNFMDIKRQDQPATESIITLRGNGNVGINKLVPTSRLDIEGNVNLSGNIKVDEVSGTPGQVLLTRSDGSTGWGNAEPAEKFQNNKIYLNTGTFTVPSGVTEIGIELWAGGGSGGATPGTGFLSIEKEGGGNAGNYRYVVLDVTPGQVFSISIGQGAASGSSSPGGYSQISLGSTIIARANGGRSATIPMQANTKNNITSSLVKFTKLVLGGVGSPSVREYFVDIDGTRAYIYHLGSGGKPYKFIGETSKGGKFIKFSSDISYDQSTGSNLAAGGASFIDDTINFVTYTGLDGGDGFAYVYW